MVELPDDFTPPFQGHDKGTPLILGLSGNGLSADATRVQN